MVIVMRRRERQWRRPVQTEPGEFGPPSCSSQQRWWNGRRNAYGVWNGFASKWWRFNLLHADQSVEPRAKPHRPVQQPVHISLITLITFTQHYLPLHRILPTPYSESPGQREGSTRMEDNAARRMRRRPSITVSEPDSEVEEVLYEAGHKKKPRRPSISVCDDEDEAEVPPPSSAHSHRIVRLQVRMHLLLILWMPATLHDLYPLCVAICVRSSFVHLNCILH